MTFEELVQNPAPPWLNPGKKSCILLSRIQLVRNMKNHPFPAAARWRGRTAAAEDGVEHGHFWNRQQTGTQEAPSLVALSG
ncbi:MAG TPA: hypothetical protein DCS74_05735, partial [Veillonellaceae bacterium]|nr:hypothetical protein [Veillonellaceae bacterium]